MKVKDIRDELDRLVQEGKGEVEIDSIEGSINYINKVNILNKHMVKICKIFDKNTLQFF